MSVKEIVDAIESVLPSRRPIEHHEPYFEDHQYECLRDFEYDKTGENVNELERRLRIQCSVRHAVAVSSGTAALHLILHELIKPGEEVLVPSLTFSATARAIQLAGGIPHFLDGFSASFDLGVYLEGFTLPSSTARGCWNKRTGRLISAVIAVDLLGFPTDLEVTEEVAKEFGLYLIEDAAQALGSKVGNRQCGSFGKAAILSFNCNKIVTGLGGGAVLTNSPVLSERIKHLSTTARRSHPWLVEHTDLGFNYRMSSMTASLICSQMDQLDFFLKKKKELHDKYKMKLDTLEDIFIHHLNAGAEPNYWLNSFYSSKYDKDQILEEMHRRGIKGRALFTPLHTLPIFADCPMQDMDECLNTFDHTVCLPSGVGLAT